MSKTPSQPAPFRAATIALLLILALVAGVSSAHAQANGSPPERMTYQGFLVDGNGVTLATNAPKNYDVVFRIWDAPTAGNRLWTEQQTVTVDKGYFSILLGEGASVGAETRNSLSTLFNTNTASERHVEMTVKGIGAGASDVIILPRLRLLSSPYAFLAQNAVAAGRAAKLVTGAGADLVTSVGAGISVAGPITGTAITGTVVSASSASFSGAVTAASFTGNGAGLTALNGANISAGTIDVNKLVAALKEALCPPGTIVAFGGDNIPAGWLLCDGTAFYNTQYPNLYAAIGTRFGSGANGVGPYFYTPDFRGRFLRGKDWGMGRDPDRAGRTEMNPGGATGDNVGSIQADAFRSHSHQWLGSNGNNSPADVDFTAGEFGSKNQYQDTLAAGGLETRPVNASVNYIIKY